MVNHLHAVEHLFEHAAIKQVSGDEGDLAFQMRKVLTPTRAQIVQHDDFVALVYERCRNVRADESGTAGD